MLNVKLIDKDKHYYFIIGIFFCILFFIQFYYYLIYFFLGSLDTDTTVKTFFFFELDLLDECNKYYLLPLLGYFIFSKYPIFLIVSALMLVNAMIFTIYITHFKSGLTTRTQFNQLSRLPNLYTVHIYC
jgi:NADH:ubiquinone oxidoreductase subunit 6 (subunit J)